MSYTDLTIKNIYGRSYNECNHPDCDVVIIAVDDKTGKVVNHGEMAHIRARNAGERWVKGYPKDQLNEADNLILLCANHHNVIDQKGAGAHYTIELLEEWKTKHYLAKEVAQDREWVYGPSSVTFGLGGAQHTLEYWRDAQDNIRFFTPEQIIAAKAAQDLAYLFAQLSGLINTIESHDPTPANPSVVTQNDGMMQILCRDVGRFKGATFSHRGKKYPSMIWRLYEHLGEGGDITLKEMSLVNTTEKQKSTSILVGGDATPERIVEAMQKPSKKDET